jgi:hypothetical protein
MRKASSNFDDELEFQSLNNDFNKNSINDGYIIIDDETGQMYRVLERYPQTDWIIKLDRDWEGKPSADVWVIPPAIGGGASPCVGVFQRIMRF